MTALKTLRTSMLVAALGAMPSLAHGADHRGSNPGSGGVSGAQDHRQPLLRRHGDAELVPDHHAAGHILINTNFEETVPLLQASVEKLGFKMTDIKIILGSHAHGDHMQADAIVKELTGGATVMAMEQDVRGAQGHEGAERQGASDRPRPQGRRAGDARRHHADRPPDAGPHARLHDLDDDRPGRRQAYNVLIACGGLQEDARLVNNKNYPEIADHFGAEHQEVQDASGRMCSSPRTAGSSTWPGKYKRLGAADESVHRSRRLQGVGRQHGEELQHAARRAEEEPANELVPGAWCLVPVWCSVLTATRDPAVQPAAPGTDESPPFSFVFETPAAVETDGLTYRFQITIPASDTSRAARVRRNSADSAGYLPRRQQVAGLRPPHAGRGPGIAPRHTFLV